jgi:hypothetical protein
MILEGIVIGTCIAGAGLLLLGRKGIRRASGYIMASDASMSAYGVSTGAASGTAVGVLGGFAGAVLLSLGLRAAAQITGSERLAVNGETTARAVTSAALSQTSWWIRSTVVSLYRGKDVVAPPSFAWSWVEVTPPRSVGQMASSMWNDYRAHRYA